MLHQAAAWTHDGHVRFESRVNVLDWALSCLCLYHTAVSGFLGAVLGLCSCLQRNASLLSIRGGEGVMLQDSLWAL